MTYFAVGLGATGCGVALYSKFVDPSILDNFQSTSIPSTAARARAPSPQKAVDSGSKVSLSANASPDEDIESVRRGTSDREENTDARTGAASADASSAPPRVPSAKITELLPPSTSSDAMASSTALEASTITSGEAASAGAEPVTRVISASSSDDATTSAAEAKVDASQELDLIEQKRHKEQLEKSQRIGETYITEALAQGASPEEGDFEQHRRLLLSRLRTEYETDEERFASLQGALEEVGSNLPRNDPVLIEVEGAAVHLDVKLQRKKIVADLVEAFDRRDRSACGTHLRRAKSFGMSPSYEMLLVEHLLNPARLLEVLENKDHELEATTTVEPWLAEDFVKAEEEEINRIDDVAVLRKRLLERTEKLADAKKYHYSLYKKQIQDFMDAVEREGEAYLDHAFKTREEEEADKISKAKRLLTEELKNEHMEMQFDCLQNQQKHLNEQFQLRLDQEKDAYDLAVEREREDFLIDQNELKAELSAFEDIIERNGELLAELHNHRKLVNDLLGIENQIQRGQETNFDDVEDPFVKEVCKLSNHPRAVVLKDPQDFADSFHRNLRPWTTAAFTTDNSWKRYFLGKIFGRIYSPDSLGFRVLPKTVDLPPAFRDPLIEVGMAGLQDAADHMKKGNLADALFALESLEGSPKLLENVKPWTMRARQSLILQQQLDILRAQIACLHVTSLS